jgi:hypothetical protein
MNVSLTHNTTPLHLFNIAKIAISMPVLHLKLERALLKQRDTMEQKNPTIIIT